MATYAAYRHIELDKVGCGKRRALKPPGGDCHDILEQGSEFSGSSPTPSNPHHRVTKPPGGETSDIFSTPVSTPPSTPRRVKNHMASNIFGSGENGVDASKNIRQKPNGNSFNRLFGSADDAADGASPPATPRATKNYQKSNVIFAENGAVGNGVNGRHANGNGYGGRPIDGSEGSISGSSSGSVTPNGSINGDVDHARHETPQTPSRRVPPGGYSTKLW